MIRHIVKLGHYQQFMVAMAAWNVEARRLGLPVYRIWESQFGAVQEVFTEAEFESLDAHLAAFEGRTPTRPPRQRTTRCRSTSWTAACTTTCSKRPPTGAEAVNR